MGKQLSTLVEDIYGLFDQKTDVKAKEEDLNLFAENIKQTLVERLGPSRPSGLRMSSIGQPCARKLWYEVNDPDGAEPSHPSLYIKFLFGSIIEQLVLFLAKTAGHTVTDEQTELVVDGVPGHTDGRIDGTPIDVKSASGYGFKKFEKGITKDDDAFGYLAQLGLYNYALGNSGSAAFVALDKSSGEIAVDSHDNLNDVNYHDLIAERKKIVGHREPPPRAFSDEAFGSSGNRKLKINCAFCAFKRECWPGLRSFNYSNGPVFLSRVERVPDVPEII